MKIPANYLPVMPYVIVKDAYRFLEFAKKIFGARQQYLAPRSEGVIMHAEIRIVVAGLKLLVPLEDREYGRGFGFADDFGNQWWVNTPL